MAIERTAIVGVPTAAALLLWPALWNGYPIVFADSGTYLSQAIHHYAGWDRPVFYSLFMLPLHATVTVWPVVVAQALLAAWVLWLVARTLVPGVSVIGFIAGAGGLAVCSWLPWLVCELMPDLFTPLLVLVVCMLAWLPDRLSPARQGVLVALAAFLMATQQSSLPLACTLGLVLGGIRTVWRGTGRVRGGGAEINRASGGLMDGAELRRSRPSVLRRWLLIMLPPAIAAFGLCTVNLAAYGRFAVSPFGNVFLLARVIYDGPGLVVLRRDCPTAHWRICPFIGGFPPTSDDFLWSADSPLRRAGGPKAVSGDAGAIVKAALIADPAGEAHAALANTLVQMTRFADGDGLGAWPEEVSPWIERDFPMREQAAYASARQQMGVLSVPGPLVLFHTITALGGVIGCVILLPFAFRRHADCAGFLLAALLILPVSAAITGGLSVPHDRYQARIMWLPAFVAMVSVASLRRRPA